MIPQLKDKSYEERLIFLDLTTLETRRLRGDLIEVFKIFKGYDDLQPSKFFKLSSSSSDQIAVGKMPVDRSSQHRRKLDNFSSESVSLQYRSFLQHVSKRPLKQFTLFDITTSSGSEFQMLTTRKLKKFDLSFPRHSLFSSFK